MLYYEQNFQDLCSRLCDFSSNFYGFIRVGRKFLQYYYSALFMCVILHEYRVFKSSNRGCVNYTQEVTQIQRKKSFERSLEEYTNHQTIRLCSLKIKNVVNNTILKKFI
jgi:hypothetical protein